MLPAILGLGGLTAKIIATAVIPRVVRAISQSFSATRPAEPCPSPAVEGISSAPETAPAPVLSGVSATRIKSRKWGYAGLWHHTPSGLDLATYRLYDAANKRWISRDPLGEGVDYNLYRYCGNDPINFVDPMGLDQVDIEPHDRPEYREHQRKRKKTIERLRCNGFDEEADLIERYQSRDPIYFWDGSWGFTSPAGPTTYIRGGLDDEMFMVTAVHEANHVKQGSSRLLKEGLRAKVLGSQDAERMQEGEVYRAEATFIEQYMNRDSSLTPAQTQTLTNRRDYANSRASSMGY